MKTLISNLRTSFAALLMLVAGSSLSAAQTVQTIIDFDIAGGTQPWAGVVGDSTGALYGTTLYGGNVGVGTVFRLNPPTVIGQGWTETVLYSFNGGAADGANPTCTLTFDGQGNLYGTTQYGGTSGSGTIFQLVPPASSGGSWTENVLMSLDNTPAAGLVIDSKGDLYGAGIDGNVFELAPPSSPGGSWSYNIIHSFGTPTPITETLIIDANGKLYGSSYDGGQYRKGLIFALQPPSIPGGEWTSNILHQFRGVPEGANPYSILTLQSGVLYGTTANGGDTAGTVFSLAPPPLPGQPWLLTTLYSFSGDGQGVTPMGGVLVAKNGLIYGTASSGGKYNVGTIFKLSQGNSGRWGETVLHSFTERNHEGGYPQGSLVFVNGAYYGITPYGGSSNAGTTFRFVP
jgi:uncharacterized repeat protein (TIGR03803 family)